MAAPAMGFVEGPDGGPVVGATIRSRIDVTHITLSGDGVESASDGLPGVDPAASFVPGQRSGGSVGSVASSRAGTVEAAFGTRFRVAWLAAFSGDLIRAVTVVGDYCLSKAGYCWASNATIANGLGLHEKAVAAMLRQVEGVLVECERRQGGTVARRVEQAGRDVRAVWISSVARNTLTGNRFKVYCALSYREHLETTTSARQLAGLCGLRAETARVIAAQLVAEGWVSREGESGGAYRYSVHAVAVAGVATQEALFAQPRQLPRQLPRRPEEPAEAREVEKATVCAGQMALFAFTEAEETPLGSTPPSPLDLVPPSPLGSAPQSSSLDQALVNRHPTAVGGGRSGAAETSVPRDAHAREVRVREADDLAVHSGEDGPLRGERQKISSTGDVQERSGPAAGGWRPVPLPPQDLLLALAPVESLWERLDRRWARDKIIDAARLELALVARWTGRQGADQALAERLTHRLRVQGGSALVSDPVGWLLGKGLPRRQECAHGACDDGVRLDTGAACATCEMRIADRRSTRRAVVGQVVAQMPDAAPGELRSAIDEQLHRHAELRAEQQVAEQQRTERRRAESEARHAVREAEAAAAEAARRVLPCEDCGAELAGGLCALCQTYRTTRTVITEAVNLALAGTANLGDRAEVGEVIRQVNAGLREEMLQSRPAGADLCGIRESDLITVRSAAAEYRASALVLLAGSPQAAAEAEQAHAAAMRRAHRHPNRASALEAAERAAEQARHNAAGCLLVQRLGAVQAMRARSRPAPAIQVSAPVREAVSA